jgi:hypothetical protein
MDNQAQGSRILGRERAKLILEWYSCFDQLFAMMPKEKKTPSEGVTLEERKIFDHATEIYNQLYGVPGQNLFTDAESTFLSDIEIPDEDRGSWVSTRF